MQLRDLSIYSSSYYSAMLLQLSGITPHRIRPEYEHEGQGYKRRQTRRSSTYCTDTSVRVT
jgi:hypothetical protein